MELWIPLTIAAAFFQNIRSVLQKHLKGRLSTLGAAYVRFLYALPVAFIYLIGLQNYYGFPIPDFDSHFLIYSLLGGICQIMFTIFLLWLFKFHNFAVGTTFSKLEVIMVALFGFILLGDEITIIASFAIAISAIGLVILSAGQAKLSFNNLLTGFWQVPTLIGLSCAAWLGGSVIFFRAASLSLQLDNFLIGASFTLLIVLIIQTLIMGCYMAIREWAELKKVFVHWKIAGLVGLSGGLTSIGWFTAFTLENATYVRALGQIELIFTFFATAIIFKEKVSRAEIVGILLIGASILLLLLSR